MNDITVHTPEIRPNFLATAMLATALLLGLADTAHAIVNVGPPAGCASVSCRVHVGREINGDMWAVYFSGLSGGTYSCRGSIKIGSNNVLGEGVLPGDPGERHRVHGGSGDDEMLLIGGQYVTSEVCGKLLIEFSGQPKVELWGNGGNDIQMAATHNESALVSGGTGDDSMIVGQLAQARGGDGSDWIIGAYPILMYGENGGDVMCSFSASQQAAVTLMDGGAGSDDQRFGPVVSHVNVEYVTDHDECEAFADYVLWAFDD